MCAGQALGSADTTAKKGWTGSMFAIGCLLPAVFFVAGAILGAMLGGNSGSMWGAGIGFVLGCAVPLAMVVAVRGGRGK